MSNYLRVTVVVAALLLPSVAAAEDAAPDQDFLVGQLRARLADQSAQIDQLTDQVAAAQQNADAGRTAQLKQQVRELLADRSFRESLTSTTLAAGYDKGFFLRSTDDKFLMKFQWQVQMRYTYYQSQPENRYLLPGFRRSDRSGFDFPRSRFKILGHAYTKDLTYLLELSGAENSAYSFGVLYAYLNYHFCDAFNVMMGRMRLQGSRAQTTKITTYQLCELPISDAVFGAGVGVGVRFWGWLADDRGRYYLDVVNSLSGSAGPINNDPPAIDSNPAVLFRTIWHVMGDNPRTDFAQQADFEHHQTPALELAFRYFFDENSADRTSSRIMFAQKRPRYDVGPFGLVPSVGLQTHQFGTEAAFKYQGFSAISEFSVRITDVRTDTAPYFQLTGDDSTNTYYGGYLQMGYLLPIPGWEDKFEVVGRLEGIGGVDNASEGVWIYTAGFNYYIDKNNVKLQTDVTKLSAAPLSSSTYSLANVNDDALIWRVQLTMSF
jgi:hypothetical protein